MVTTVKLRTVLSHPRQTDATCDATPRQRLSRVAFSRECDMRHCDKIDSVDYRELSRW